MPRVKAPKDHSEFGGGGGLVDPVRRADRIVGSAAGPTPQGVAEELWEIYATDPSKADENLAEVEIGKLKGV